MMPPKRFRTAWYFALLFSFVAVGLAIVPNFSGTYDPNLAVLTLTVVAVVWYTYFTYCGLHRESPTVLQLQVEGVMHPGRTQLNPGITNLSPRTVVATLHLTVSVDDDEVPLGAIYRGETPLTLSPHEVFRGSVPVSGEIMKPQRGSMRVMLFTREAIRVVFRVDWTDDLKEEGTVGPKYWHATSGEPTVLPVIAQENIDRIFPRTEPTVGGDNR